MDEIVPFEQKPLQTPLGRSIGFVCEHVCQVLLDERDVRFSVCIPATARQRYWLKLVVTHKLCKLQTIKYFHLVESQICYDADSPIIIACLWARLEACKLNVEIC